MTGASSFKFNSDTGQRQGVAQGNEVAGLFRRLDAGDARDAQHIALFGVARLDERQRGGLHLDAAAGHGSAVGGGLGSHVDHVGLALGVEMREWIHDGQSGEAAGNFGRPGHHTGMRTHSHSGPATGACPAGPALDLGPKRPFALIRQALAALILIAFCTLHATPAPAQSRLPMLGDGSELAAGQERRLGDGIARQLYRDPDYLDDPVLLEYVQTLWDALRAAARAQGELAPELDERFAWEVLLGRDRTVNAFALPGGYLGVHLGLIGVTASRDELASVLAHELSHITQRHIARLIAQQGRQTPLVLGALVLGALAAGKNPDAAQALAIGGQALAVQNQLNFSRDMEREADRVGFALMDPAGFAPQGFVAMFEKLQQANRINDNASWPYLRSHPLTTQRIADVQARLPVGAARPAAPGLEHALLAARARVLARPGVDVLRQWMAEPQAADFAGQPQARRAGALYAAALAARELGEPARAQRLVGDLQEAVRPDAAAQRQVRLLAAELALARGDAAGALKLLPPAGGRPELLLRAQAQLRGGTAPDIAGLQTWVAGHPGDAGAWQQLASVWHAQGQVLRAVRAEAEAQAARYDYAAAVDRLKAGQDLARQSRAAADHVEASIIDTRLRAMESLLREQAAER